MPASPGAGVAAGLILLAACGPAHADIPVVELQGVVHAVTAGHVVQAIERADAAGAPLLVLRLDTPGGLDTAMRQIVDKMLNCRTPVAVWVGPSGARAASAGFIITVAADVAAMAPGTNIGAAHPVSGLGQMDEVMSKKVASDAAAYIRSKAARRGRNVEMAEKAVLESRSFTEKEALESRLVDLVVKDVPVAMDWRQMILSAIARPEVLFLLLLGALAGLGTEISHPGLLFPGIVGLVCLILFLFASQIIPVNWAGVLLILLAIGLFAAEVKVASYGLLTAAGITAMILGAMMLVDSPIRELRPSPWKLLPAAAAMAAGTILLLRLVIQAQRQQATTGAEGMVGLGGTTETSLDPEGWVLVQGERWRARAEEPLGPGARVRVVAVEGLRLGVRKGA
jgi:membrane-bound serine protease (ClpP class)